MEAKRKTLVLWAIREMASRAFALLVVFALALVSTVQDDHLFVVAQGAGFAVHRSGGTNAKEKSAN